MATHGRTGFAHLLIGSTAEQVVRHATCQVFALRASLADNRILSRSLHRWRSAATKCYRRAMQDQQQDPFQIEAFAPSSSWVPFYQDDRFSQRHRIGDGKIFCETIARIDASADRILERLVGPWDWWEKGCYEKREELEDGRIRFVLWPIGKLRRVRIEETVHPPVALEGGGWRVRADMGHHFVGVAYFEIRPLSDGGCSLVGRFAGVEIAGLLPRILGIERFCCNHLLAERGALGFPFPSRTGWVGLIESLEGPFQKACEEVHIGGNPS